MQKVGLYEICLKSMLYKYRIKNKNDFYECSIDTIKKAFVKCDNSIKCMNQTGGGFSETNMINFHIDKLKTKLSKVESKI